MPSGGAAISLATSGTVKDKYQTHKNPQTTTTQGQCTSHCETKNNLKIYVPQLDPLVSAMPQANSELHRSETTTKPQRNLSGSPAEPQRNTIETPAELSRNIAKPM